MRWKRGKWLVFNLEIEGGGCERAGGGSGWGGFGLAGGRMGSLALLRNAESQLPLCRFPDDEL
jgi:hypothetical protein